MFPLTYELHGLSIRSTLPLNAPQAPNKSPDLVITHSRADSVPESIPSGTLLAELYLSDRLYYAAVRARDDYLMRFPSTAECAISADLRTIECKAAPGVADEIASLIVRGGVISFLLMLQGKAVLHGSAVEIDRKGIGFVGDPSMGKSTTAALLCTIGGKLIADDALTLETSGGLVTCQPGGTSLRLRKGAEQILQLFLVAPETATTLDGRIEVFPAYSSNPVPLAAVVIPQPRRDVFSVKARRVEPARAAFLLARFSRIPGLLERELVMRKFDKMAQVAAATPVIEAQIPWGPPFECRIAEELVDQVLELV